jgi:hypothetical protein
MDTDNMSDEEFLAQLKKMSADDAERKKQVKDRLYHILNERLDIAWVEVDCDGSGDEGQIEEIRYFDIDQERLKLAERKLDEAVEKYVFSLLPCGWEINEGSQGTVEIDVIEGKTVVTHSRCVTQEYTEEFEE